MKSLEFKKLSIAEASADVDRDPIKVDSKRVVQRRSQTSAVLSDEASRWIESLPANVRPLACASKFPRIANSIADLWRRVTQCEEYLDSLVIDLRGDRAGFPPDVAKELFVLRNFYSDLHPQQDDAWGLQRDH